MCPKVIIRSIFLFWVFNSGWCDLSQNYEKLPEKQSRAFGFGQVKNYLNDECITNSKLKGTCMRRLHCLRYGGRASGFCGGFGVCCEINLSCGETSSLKRTVIRNPETLPMECTYRLQAYSRNVCQVRIDFDIILSQPTTAKALNPQCVRESFEVDGIRLCGTNVNQHIYVPFDGSSASPELTINFQLASRAQGSTVPAYWNMVVTQLECPQTTKRNDYTFISTLSPSDHLQNLRNLLHFTHYDYNLLAPVGCLQYFTAKDGVVQSFNFDTGLGPYIVNMSYAICFARDYGDSNIQFIGDSFTLPAKMNPTTSTDLDCHNPAGATASTPDDYLLIPNSMFTDNTASGTFYCGTSLQNKQLIYSPQGPFVIYFKSDNNPATTNKLGFRLTYHIR